MKIEELRRSRRSASEWEPFMRALSSRLRADRRRAILARAAAVALVALLAGGLWLYRIPRSHAPMLRADVPSATAPLFQPKSGVALATAEGILVIPSQEKT